MATSSTCLLHTSSLLSRLASNSSAGCSGATAVISHQGAALWQQLRGLAGFTKATTTKGAAMKRKKGAASGGADEENPRVRAMVAMLQPPEPAEAKPLTPAEQAAAQLFQQQRVAEHHAWVKDMSTKHKLQQAALRALPERLRVLAMQPDHTPYPLNRKFLFDSPPASYRDTTVTKTARGASGMADAGGAGKGSEAPGGGKQAGGKQGGSRRQQGGR